MEKNPFLRPSNQVERPGAESQENPFLRNRDEQGLQSPSLEQARKELEIGYEMSKDSPYDFSGERTLGGTATEISKAFPREAAAGALQSIEGLKEYSQYLPAARVATTAVEKGLGFLGFEPGKEGEDSPFRKARDYLREDSFLRGDDKYQDVWTVKLGGGAGSTMPFLLSRYFLGPIGLRATAFGSGAGEQADRIKQAREAGVDVSELEEFGGLTLGGAIGLSETYLPERLVKTLKSVPKSIPIGEKNRIMSMVKRGLSATPEIIKTGGKEGAQEVFSSIAQTLVEMGYNPEAELPSGQSLWDDFSVGFVVGAGADAIANGVAARRVNAVSDIDLEREREARQAEDANNFMLGQQLRDQAEQRAMMEADPLAFERQALAARQGASQVAMPSLEEVSRYVAPSVTSKDPTPASTGELYAMRIIGSLRNYFPSQASFTVEQDGDGFRVVDESGIQYGQRMGDKRVASSVASNLNKEISNKGIRGSILDTLMTSPDSYSPQDADALFRYGFRTLSPEANRVSFGALNEAAGTTTEKGYVEDLPLDLLAGAKKLRDGRYSIQMPDGSTQYIAGLTASQKLNLERTQNGLPPATTFDIKEARQFLNGNLGALSQPAISGIQDNAEYGGTLDEDGKPVVMSSAGEVLTGRVVTEAEKLRAGQDEDGNDILPDYIEFKTLDEAKRYAGRLNQRGQGSRFLPAEVLRGKKDLKPDIKRLLAAKNIASEPDSEEVGQLVKSFTGADSFADMSLDDQKLFYARVRELPALSKPSKIPVFKTRSMTTEELGRREIEQKQEKRLREEERQGVEAFPVEFELVNDIARLGIPLEMFKVKTRITDREGNDITDQTEGYYDPALEELVVAIDSIDPEGKLTEEERVYKLRDVLTHETMHALRAMDLFTQKEWSLLESAVARTKRKPGPDDKEQRDETYLQRARRMYPDESPLVQVEEAVAELARDYIGNRKLIGGKPKSLLERLIRFFTKLRNFVDGKGFNSFSDVLRAVETGRVGRRKRGQVRSLRTTEAQQFDLYGAVPARYAPFIDEFEGAPVVAPPSPLPTFVQTQPTQGAGPTTDFDLSALEGADVRYSRKDTGQTAVAKEPEVRNPNLVQRSPEVLQEAVQKVENDIKDTGRFAVPLYSPDASPDAMYVAMNPDFGQKLSEDEKRRYSRKNTPQFGQKAKDIMDRVTPEMPDETLGETILKKMELPPVRDMTDKFRKNFVNRYARLERQYRQNPELKALLADVSSMAMTEMADHSRQFVQRALVYGVPVYEKGMVKVKDFIHKGKKYRGLIEVMAMLHTKEHGNLEPLAHAYATAVRGERLNKEGKLSPVKPGELKVLEEEVNKFINPATGQPIIKEWFETWQSYNSNIVKFLKDTGVIDDAGAELWLKQSDYVPFYRENAEGNLEFPRVFGGLHTAGQFKAVGKSDKALNVDMITAITGNIDAAIAMGMKNVAQQRIIRDQMKLGLASLLKPGEAVGNRNSVSFKVAGKRYTAIIDDPLIYESMLPVSEIALDGLFGNFLRIPASWLRELIIREPGYMVANMFRDTLSSYVITGAQITPLVDTAKNMFADLTDLENLGVVGGYDLRIDRDSVKKFYEKNSKLMGMKGGVNWKNPIMAAWDGLGRLSTRSEAATRLAVYNDILARTGNEAEAQYQALSVMNYGRRGGNPMFRALTAIVPFMNARVQGLDKLWQATFGRIGAKYETDAQGNITRNLSNFKNFQLYVMRAGLIIGISALYYGLMHDDDEYKNATPEVRDNYYIIPIKKGNVAAGEPGLAVRLPIPFEVGILFKVIPERFLAATFGEDTTRDMTESFWRNLKSTLAMNPIPQSFLPIVEVGFNKDTYTGRPIVPTYMENLLPEQQTTFYTNKFVEDIANMMGFSPMKVDHIVQGYGGSLGAYLLQAVDSAWRSGGEKKPALAWYQYPVVKRFFATANQPGLQSQFYDLKDYMDGITKTINDLEERGQYDDLAAFYAKNGHIYEMRSTVNYMNRYITRLRDQRKMVEQMDIDPESKREMIEQINMQIAASLTTVPMLRQQAFGPRPENEQ